MKQFEKSKEQRREKIQERAELERRKVLKDRRYRPIEDDAEIEELLIKLEHQHE